MPRGIEVPPQRLAATRDALQDWFRAGHRDLPWRRTRDPYAILISEAMLQQTRVETVIPYYERFLAKLPSFAALAAAPHDDVMALWAGLGYYRRAASLQACARAVVERHGGELPRDEEALLALPGVGAYTAGALRSIAFHEEAALVDGNVVRVLSRLFRIQDGLGAARAEVWRIAGLLVRGARPSDLNQGLMELGATVCTPRKPRCEGCPLAARCDAKAAGDAESFPTGKTQSAVRAMALELAWIERDGAVLLVKRPAVGLWAGLWDLPSHESDVDAGASPGEIASRIGSRLALAIELESELARCVHVLSHRRVEARVWRARLASERVAERAEEGGEAPLRWMPIEEPQSRGTSTLTRRLWKDVLEARRRPALFDAAAPRTRARGRE
ncbi:MAG: A/G-specific adenine glycosylase [Deltaproteobacteria bacterium]|nr:A/G-specific adenine glycosylase [Deltaproteobacteria bacterium]